MPLRAIARNAKHIPLPGSIATKWTGAAAFDDVAANPARARAMSAGDHPVKAAMGGKSATGRLVIGSALGVEADRITLPHVDGGPISVVVLDAKDDGGKCHEDLSLGIAGDGALAVNLSGGADCAASTLGVLSDGAGVLYECQSNGLNCLSDPASRWTVASDHIDFTTSSPPTLPAPLAVEVVVWDRMQGDPAARVAADLSYANVIYARRHAGMRFTQISGGNSASDRTFTAPGGCDDPGASLGVTPKDGALNIVYADAIKWGLHSIRGFMCDRTDGAPRLLVVSRTKMTNTTLAHELTHAMGLLQSIMTDDLGGHTTKLPEFDETNLMWNTENATAGLVRDHLSVGQVLRMNIDARSWVNVSRNGAFGRIRNGDTEICQANRKTTAPCPRLHQEAGVP